MLHSIDHSSGNLLADRRASYAAALGAEHAFSEAAELMVQALELVPGWVAGWHLLGGYREAGGDVPGALAAWNELLTLDERGVFGARLKLAAHRAIAVAAPQTAYVQALFDDYAPRFEESLVGRLAYRVPQQLATAIEQVSAGRHFGRVVDLGCGTGLMGQLLRPLADRLEGVDLSAGMLAEARRKGIYDRLEQDDLVAFLAGEDEAFDLIAAADVLNYVGTLEPVLTSAVRALSPGGLIAFSLEIHADDEPVRVATSLRFQHAPTPALVACEALGLDVRMSWATSLRLDRGEPVSGMIIVAVRRCDGRRALPGLR
ncbi:methyltransferase domain-containing protein [Nocardia sp. NPDC051570]|uniref:methyltransferase domain-containing protein n=1 Tax=Nocardia sp. NPDC051570 TaxID=3364324 RepID=UPI00379F78F9